MKSILVLCCSLLLLGCSKQNAGSFHPAASDTSQVAGQTSREIVSPPNTYEQRQGKYLYLKYCAVCHGDQGGADGFNTYNLDPKPHSLADSDYVAALSDATLAQVIAMGGRGVNKSPLMPAYQGTLNKDQITFLVAHVRELSRSETETQ
ncbi:MAG TPA: cytochrome c [Bacteroidota bacterium]|jgi:mono/diheme cytochrome c family protein